MMKLPAIVVILSIVIARCVSENRMTDEVQYKNHRSSKNDTPSPAYKYPVYPAQVYADLSKDPSPAMPSEQSDVVRMYFNPSAIGKRKQNQTVSTTQASMTFASSSFKTTPPPMYFVTTDQKSPVYSHSSPSSGVRGTADLSQGLSTGEDGPKRKPAADGVKMRRVLKSQHHQAQQLNLLYASTTQLPPTAVNNNWNNSSANPPATVMSKVNSSNASKPFTTVLVPKQILDGNHVHQHGDNSFRPIAPPAFSYKPSIDANVVENRRAGNSVSKTSQPTVVPMLTKYGFTKPAVVPAAITSYKVEEYKQSNDGRQQSAVFDKNSNVNNNQRSDHIHVQHNTPKHDIKYGFAVPESYMNTEQTYAAAEKPNRVDQAKYEPFKQDLSQKNIQKYDTKQGAVHHREYYPATEVPSKKDTKPYSFSPYNPAPSFNMKPSPVDIAGPPFEFEKAAPGSQKTDSSPPAWYTPSINSNSESNGPAEIIIDDSNTKGVLKSILRDMLKSKQQNEKLPSGNMDDIIDSYFKTNRPNVDFSLGNYDIETDMSCNLRSSRHITDGQCVTSKPVVEAVCADRCLVYATANPFTNMRSSSTANQQVEALHCVDGDSKLVRVQLQCKDGNTLNNVIKVVTSCRCKLHQIQPQMRSNTPSITSSSMQDMMVNPDIMQIASGKF